MERARTRLSIDDSDGRGDLSGRPPFHCRLADRSYSSAGEQLCRCKELWADRPS